MKKLIDTKYFKLGATIFILIAACILFFFLIFKIDLIASIFLKTLKILSPFIIGFIIAYLLNPIVNFFEKNVLLVLFENAKNKTKSKKISKFLAISITCIIVIAVVVILFNFIIPELLKSIEVLITNTPRYLEQTKNYLLSLLKNHEDLEKMVLSNYDNITNYLTTSINNTFLPKIEEWIVIFSNGIFGAIKVMYTAVIGFVVSIYFLYGKDNFKAQIKKILYGFFEIKIANNIIDNARHTDKIFGGFIIGKILDCLVIGLITFIFLTIFGYPYALLIGVLVGITNIIPYFGPFIGGIPSALLVLLHTPSKVLILIIFLILLQQVDSYFIEPKLAGIKTGIKSFWVLFSIIVFGSIFGIPGMIVGVPTFALIYGYISNRVNNNLLKKELPIETSAYEDVVRINSESKKIIKDT